MATASTGIRHGPVAGILAVFLAVMLLGSSVAAQQAPAPARDGSTADAGAKEPAPSASGSDKQVLSLTAPVPTFGTTPGKNWKFDVDPRSTGACPTCPGNFARFTGIAAPNVKGQLSYTPSTATHLTFGMVGSRTSLLPLHASTLFGTPQDVGIPRFFVDPAAGVSLWTITASAQRVLKRTASGNTIEVIGDLFLPLNGQVVDGLNGPGTPSKAARVGLRFGY